MGKMHKELAKFLMQEAGNEEATDQTIIKVNNCLVKAKVTLS